jgi:hypothetical protein
VHHIHLAAPQLAMALKQTSLADAAAVAAQDETKRQEVAGGADVAAERVRELQRRAQEAAANQLQRTRELDDKNTCCSCCA